MSRRFEGAAGGRRNDGWQAHGSDANAEIGPALSRLRNRARDLRRNNQIALRLEIVYAWYVFTDRFAVVEGDAPTSKAAK